CATTPSVLRRMGIWAPSRHNARVTGRRSKASRAVCACRPAFHVGLQSHRRSFSLVALDGHRRLNSIGKKGKENKISGLRREIDIIHKQRVNASLAECDDRVGGRADNWLAVVEGRIDDDRYSGSCKKAGYEIVKARI